MRCLINQLTSSDRLLHQAAEKSMKALLARAHKDPTSGVSILQALLARPNGRLDFDKISKTKTIETIIAHLPYSDYGKVVNLFDEQILQPGGRDEKENNMRRLDAADQLVQAVRHCQRTGWSSNPASNEASWIRMLLNVLGKYAYFDIESMLATQSGRPIPQVSLFLRQQLRDRVSSCLSCLVSKSVFASYFAHILVMEIVDGPSLLKADANVQHIIADARAMLDKMSSNPACKDLESPEGSCLCTIILLYSVLMLQVYNGDTAAVAMLEDLNRSQEDKASDESAILVEILLSFASKPSQLFRRLCQQVFMSCSSSIGQEGLESMVKV